MNKLLIYSGTLLGLVINSHIGLAQTANPFRFEAEAGVATLNLPTPYRTGSLYRQQLTGYVNPRLGVALGLSWGSSVNRDPLKTRYANPATTTAPPLPDPVALRSFYQRSEQMTDLALVYRPLISKRHLVSVRVGLSAYRRREFGVDSVRFIDAQKSYYETIGKFIDTRQVVPMAAIHYDVTVSSRWAVGLNGTAYFTGGGKPTTTFGLHGLYRFNFLADSLSIHSVNRDDLRVGVRAGTSITTGTGSQNPGSVSRTRFVGGLWAELPLSLTWAIRGEVNYAQRGYRIRETQTSVGTYQPAFGNLNYLDIPLLFRHEIAYRWHLYGGPYLAFFMSGYTETSGQRNQAVQPHTGSGLVLGTSYNLTRQLAVDLRYQRDLVALSTANYGNYQSFQLGLSWQLTRK